MTSFKAFLKNIKKPISNIGNLRNLGFLNSHTSVEIPRGAEILMRGKKFRNTPMHSRGFGCLINSKGFNNCPMAMNNTVKDTKDNLFKIRKEKMNEISRFSGGRF